MIHIDQIDKENRRLFQMLNETVALYPNIFNRSGNKHRIPADDFFIREYVKERLKDIKETENA